MAEMKPLQLIFCISNVTKFIDGSFDLYWAWGRTLLTSNSVLQVILPVYFWRLFFVKVKVMMK